MRELFPGHYRPEPEDFDALLKAALFVFDTSVFTNLYRYPGAARSDLLAVMDQLKSRIWIPYQVALEFQQNRLAVIAEQKRKFIEVEKVVEKGITSLNSELRKLQLEKRHSTISTDTFLSEITACAERFQAELTKNKPEHLDVNDEDPIRTFLDNMLHGRIGEEPTSQEYLETIYKEGQARYVRKCPPGYMDIDKSQQKDSIYQYGALVDRREYGDLIIWNQIKDYAASRALKEIIFVTDDEKEDWWLVVESLGAKTIGPRAELVKEMSDIGVSSFYMYNSERFLELASRFLELPVKQESITQVRDVSQFKKQTRSGYARPTPFPYADSVINLWLLSRFSGRIIQRNVPHFPNYCPLRWQCR